MDRRSNSGPALGELQPLRVLLLEDSARDAELTVRELRKAGYALQWTRVDTEDGFREAILSQPDLIIADFTLPQFDGVSAVQILRRAELAIPVIIVSGTITEEAAVAAMKAGADDYLLKDRLARLGPAVRNALEQRRLRTEEQRAQLSLLQSEARYRRLLTSMSALVVEVDTRGTVLYVNETVPAVTGYAIDEVVGRNGIDLLFPGEARKELDGAAIAFARGEDLRNYVTRVRTKSGAPLVLEWSTANQYDATGALQKVVGFGMDVTAREAASTRIHKLSRLYAAISEANAALARSRTADDLFTAVCTACVNHGDFKLAWVGLVDPGRRLVAAKACGPAIAYLDSMEISIDANVPEGRGVAGSAYRERRVYICNDMAQDPISLLWQERAAAHGLAACIALPLFRDRKVVGVLSAYAGETGVFDEETVALLENMAENISAALDQFQREEQRLRAEDEVRRAEARLREAQQIAKIGDWELDIASGRMIWSPELYQLYRRDPAQGPGTLADVLGFCFDDCLDARPGGPPRWTRASDRYEVEQQVRLCDGDTAFRLHTVIVVRDRAGALTKIYGTVQDVTERRRIEEERSANARRLAELSRELVRIQEDERRRLARELHDRTSPNLSAVSLNLSMIAAELPREEAEDLDARLADTTALLEDTIAGIREISADLHPSALEHAGLVPALRGYAVQFARRTGIDIVLPDETFESCLSADKETALFRIAQEALTNCVKHSAAKSISLAFAREGGRVVMSIVDDGVGFDPALLGKDGRTPGLGLLTMRERAEFAGGELDVVSAPGKGVCVSVRI
jgi:two-component system, NarL family, sensor histidine kinase UhpB